MFFVSKENFMLLIVFRSSGIWTSSSSKMPLLHFQRSQEEYDMKSNSSDWICNILATYVWTLQQASRVGTVSVIVHTRNRLESWRFSRSGGGCSSALVDGWEAECFNGVGGGRRACCCAQSVRRCVLNIKKPNGKPWATGNMISPPLELLSPDSHNQRSLTARLSDSNHKDFSFAFPGQITCLNCKNMISMIFLLFAGFIFSKMPKADLQL